MTVEKIYIFKRFERFWHWSLDLDHLVGVRRLLALHHRGMETIYSDPAEG